MDDNKKKALSAALGQIEKQFGKGAVMRMGYCGMVRGVEVVTNGFHGRHPARGHPGPAPGLAQLVFDPAPRRAQGLFLVVVHRTTPVTFRR